MNIRKLVLYTDNLKEQIRFYGNRLGLEIKNIDEGHVILKVGSTDLEFVGSAEAIPYHFAVNIPANKAEEALAWVKERVKILKDGDSELVDFKSWKALSIYFYDAGRNVVELIAREKMGATLKGSFGPGQFLHISEIGMPVDDIKQTWERLDQLNHIGIYDGGFEQFCAIGDERGLFIVVDRRRKKWFPTSDPARSSPFRIEGDFNFEFSNGKINEIGRQP